MLNIAIALHNIFSSVIASAARQSHSYPHTFSPYASALSFSYAQKTERIHIILQQITHKGVGC